MCTPALADNDPTRPPTPAEIRMWQGLLAPDTQPAQQWVLESILTAPQRRIAIINGQRVTEGATVDGARVLHIGARGVSLDTGERRIELDLDTHASSEARVAGPTSSTRTE
ncbi:general secretion pathway protein GspB [Ectothiorhodospira variabilis]|nr:general secretion pathway protein GspB [Ectothiorhodospira variabilis]